jgi:carboxyvinyl-carboxyphosphonate phosphorylmutase
MQFSDRRNRLRTQLAASDCIRPASVFDPVSARIAEALGFEFGMLGGSIASAAVLGAPDLAVLTLTELAEQCRHITRASDISMIIDADHGYGNALSVMRTVRELEDAGVSGMTIEDTVLPQRYGHQGVEELVPLDEMTAKLRAAVGARQDPSTVIIGRTHTMNTMGLDDAVARVRAFDGTGVDAVFVLGIRSTDQLEAVRAATTLPIVLGTTPAALDNATLATYGVRIALRGHGTFNAAVKAVYDSLKHQAEGGEPAEVSDTFASAEVMGIATGSATYEGWRADYL